MILSVVGETDKRPFIYTILKVSQYLGDVLFVTSNRHYARLIEEREEDLNGVAGHFQNIFIVVTDMTPDEARQEIGYNDDDYEIIVYDNQIDPNGDMVIYIAGCAMSEFEEDLLSYLEEGTDYTTIHFGFGKSAKIPYTVNMFKNCEIVEGKKIFLPIDSKITQTLVKLLSPVFNVPTKTLEKVVNKRT